MRNQSRRPRKSGAAKFEKAVLELANLQNSPSRSSEREYICEYVEDMVTELVKITSAAGEELLAHLLERALLEANVGRSRARSRASAA